MAFFPCPYLQGEVEFIEERERHIAARYPDLFPEYRGCIAETLADPDQVRRSVRFGNARLFSRWFQAVRGGKYIVVVVVTETTPARRHWIVTAYLARKRADGEPEWQRS